MMKRGDIHYIMEGGYTGSEQNAGRPAIIVSNDKCNLKSPVVVIVFLTTKPKLDMPTHVTIRSTPRVSTALCEQITSVSVERVGDFVATCTEEELNLINTALSISLMLQPSVSNNDCSKVELLKKELELARFEKETYQLLYDNVMKTIFRRD